MGNSHLDTETAHIPIATFEAVAVGLGFITQQQVDDCRAIHTTLLDLGLTSTIAEVCLKKGILTPAQIATVQNAIGQRGDIELSGYEIIGKIAEGGMGVVYKARQISMDRMVAVKVLQPKFANDRTGRERFIREARAVAKLSHPNVVTGIDAGEVAGVYYFVMEYLDGEPMDQILRHGPLPWREASAIIRQIAAALDHADKHGIVHRDVKPGNIMLLKDGIAKLADLGLARATESEDAELTQTGMIVGSPAYLSPEQARGEPAIDIRTDIFSLGLSFFEFVTGHRAYAGSNPQTVLNQLLTRDVVLEQLTEKAAPADLIAIIAKMTQRDRVNRYQTPIQLCEDLDALLENRTPFYATGNASRQTTDDHSSMHSANTSTSSNLILKSNAVRISLAAGFVLLVMLLALWIFERLDRTDTPPTLSSTNSQPLDTKMGLVDAIDLALKQVPGGNIYHAEQELGRYSIDFAIGDRTANIVIDGKDGSVVEKLVEDGNHSVDVQMTKISIVSAIKAAEKAASGRAIEAGILLLPGRAVIEVKIIRSEKIVWLDVDGITGKVSSERSNSLLPN